jgi:pimeloyl-ACP methyl ester carboxylesterase
VEEAGRDNLTLRLRDGRVLGYAEQGDADGAPLLMFHGLPGSRLTRHPDGSIARGLGLRLVTFDRPGIGLSTPQPRRTMLDWPRDVEEFADAQGLERFDVLGWSGGAPYALATAHELPERVTRVTLIAPVLPLAGTRHMRQLALDLRWRARLARFAPWLVGLTIAYEARGFARNPERSMRGVFARAPACDRSVLDDPQLLAALISSRHESYRQGAANLLADALIFLKPWGFDPAEVQAPVRIWHGAEDETIAPLLGQRLADVLRGAEVTLVPGEAHMLCLTRWKEILAALAA